MSSTRSYVAILPDGREFFFDTDFDHESEPHAAQSAIIQSGLTAPRSASDAERSVKVMVHRLRINHGKAVRDHAYHACVDLPFARMTEEDCERAMKEELKSLPAELASFVSSQAWGQGQSAGYEEVVNIAGDMAAGLLGAFNKYLARTGGK